MVNFSSRRHARSAVAVAFALFGAMLYWAPAANAETPVPAAPSAFAATAAGPHAIQLTWQDNATNETGFVVVRDGQEQAVDLVGANIQSYLWTGLQPGTRYCFYVASKTYGPDGTPTGFGNQQSVWVGPACATTTGAPIDGSKAVVSVAPRTVQTGGTFYIQGRLWIPNGTLELSAPNAEVTTSTAPIGADGAFRIELGMDVPPGTWTLQLTENTQGVTISRTVELRVLGTPGQRLPSAPKIVVTPR